MWDAPISKRIHCQLWIKMPLHTMIPRGNTAVSVIWKILLNSMVLQQTFVLGAIQQERMTILSVHRWEQGSSPGCPLEKTGRWNATPVMIRIQRPSSVLCYELSSTNSAGNVTLRNREMIYIGLDPSTNADGYFSTRLGDNTHILCIITHLLLTRKTVILSLELRR